MKFPRRLRFNEWTGTGIYLLFGLGWILGGYFISDLLYAQRETSLFELFKGLAFVAITALLVFALMAVRRSEPADSEVETEHSNDLDRWLQIRQRSYWSLIAAVVSIVLAIFFAVYLGLTFVRDQTLRHEEEDTSTVVYSVAAQIGASLETVDLILRKVAENRLRHVKVPNAELRLLQQSADEYVRAIWLLDKDGKIVEDLDDGRIGTDHSDREYFAHHLENAPTGLFIGNSMLSRSTGEPYFCASRGIRGDDGEFLGVACAALDQARFASFWQLPADREMVGVSLLNEQNEVLLRNSASHHLTETTFNSLRLETGIPTIVTVKNASGELSLAAGVNIESFPGLKVVVEVPLQERINELRLFVNTSLAGYLGISLLLFGILYLLIRQFRASESLERRIAMLASYPLDNINPIFTVSPGGNYNFLNPAAARLLDSLEDTPALVELQEELVRISKQQKSGSSEFNLRDRALLVSVFAKSNGDCDLYLTDVTEARRDSSTLSLFFELPFIGMAITSPETKGWVRVNDQLCEIFGYPRDELTKLSWPEITHPDDLDVDLENFNKILAGESEGYRMDKRFIRRDGATIHATIDVRVIRKPSGEIDFFVATIQDITERKHSERVLRLQRNLYAALSSSNHAIVRLDNRADIFRQVCQAAVDHAGVSVCVDW